MDISVVDIEGRISVSECLLTKILKIQMDYEDWISRERKIRSKLLMSSPEIKNKSICRACKDCGEICLCHEINCPNCGGSKIVDHHVHDVEKEVLSGNRMRCSFRFKSIVQIEGHQNIP